MSKANRYFLYARKSTDDASRQIRSIDDQLAEVRALAAREKLEVVEELIEKQSAKDPGRPIFTAMLARIEKGEAQGILAWHPDRLTRNAVDAGQLIHLVDRGKIKDLKFPTVQFEVSANGKFMLGVLLSQSKYYTDNLAEHIKRGKDNKAKNGLWPQAAPIGYMNDKRTRLIVPDPVHGPLVKLMFEMYASGDYSLKELRDEVVKMGLLSARGKPPSVSKVQTALGNPLYYGVIRYNGEYFDGKHQALVTRAVFDECHRVMHTRGKVTHKRRIPFMYRGLVRCGACGCLITLEQQRQYRYIRCTRKRGGCPQPYAREEELHAQVRESVRLVSLSDKTANEIYAELDKRSAAQEILMRDEESSLRDELARCDQRLDRLMKVYLDSAISLEEFRATKNDLVVEKRKVEEKLAEIAKGVTGRFEQLRGVVKSCQRAFSIAQGGDAEETLRFFKSVGLNMTLRDRRLRWEPRGDWQVVVGERFVELDGTGSGSVLASGSAQEREEKIKRRLLP
jgi:site-specific DNA recombinase